MGWCDNPGSYERFKQLSTCTGGAVIDIVYRRIAALAIDVIIPMVVTSVIGLLVIEIFSLELSEDTETAAALVLFWVLFLVYNAVAIYLAGYTLGKRLLRIRVVPTRVEVEPAERFRFVPDLSGKVTPGQSAARALLLGIEVLLAWFALIPVLTDDENRSLGDRVSATRVVKISC